MVKMHGCFPLAFAVALLTTGAPTASGAHEYWIDPEHYVVDLGETVPARLLVGEMMKGTELPWLSHQTRSFTVAAPSESREESGMEGDLPALSFVPDEPGLHIIALETEPLLVEFETLAEFGEYLEYEGLAKTVQVHRSRALPDTAIKEAYARAAKSLVQVGPVRAGDVDRELGLPFEIVALGNPYAGQDTLPVRLTWQGGPAADVQISVFREDGGVERSLVHTDADGRADIPLLKGRYLLNAVHIDPVDGEEHVWKSTWASLSFAVPADE